MGLAVIEASACGVPAFGTPVGAHAVALAGIEGSACLEWDPRALARGAGAARRGGGPAGRRPRRRGALLRRPHGRAGGGGMAGAAGGGAPSGHLYSLRPDVPHVPDKHERPPSTHQTPGRRRGDPDGADRAPRSGPRIRPFPPAAGADGQRLPAGVAPEDLERRSTTGRRSKLRRRARFLRRARELALRDLGGLVYEARRREQDGGALVEEKVKRLGDDRRGAARPRGRARHAARRDGPARARRRRHVPALRGAARERRDLLRPLRREPGRGRRPRRRRRRGGGAGRRRRPKRAPKPRRRRNHAEAGACRTPAEAAKEPAPEARPRAASRGGNGMPRQPATKPPSRTPSRSRTPRTPSRHASPRTPPTARHDRGRDASARHRAGVPALRRLARRPTRSGA